MSWFPSCHMQSPTGFAHHFPCQNNDFFLQFSFVLVSSTSCTQPWWSYVCFHILPSELLVLFTDPILGTHPHVWDNCPTNYCEERSWHDNVIKVNPEKFQTLVVKMANEVNDMDLNISGQTIKPTSCVKLLGLFIDDQLTFDKHVSELCMRVARQTNALRRIVKYLTPECKIIMYTAFIASNFNYCHIMWHFCGHTNSLKIKKLHKHP